MNELPNCKVVYLIRHGESSFNANLTDDIDCNLTDLGKKQSLILGERLSENHFDLVIVSPLARALQTLEISKLIYDRMEINHLCREYKIDKCDFLFGEKIEFEKEDDVKNRCLEFRLYLESINCKRIAVICHSDFIYYFTSGYNNDGIWLDNADYTIINIS